MSCLFLSRNLLMLQTLKIYVKKYSAYIKWWLVIATIFFMLMAIQVYTNFLTIIEATELTNLQTQKIQEEMDYINNFQLKYLDSDHAMFFLSHENNILKPSETVIAFREQEMVEEQSKNETKLETITPFEEWKEFFNEKIEKIKG